MAGIEDIINNPNFGRMYRNNSQFRKMADRMLSDTSTKQTSLFNKIRIAVDTDNKVRFNAGAAGTFNNLREAVINSWAGWRTNKETTAATTAYNGAYHNKLAQAIARGDKNISVNVKTFDTQIGSVEDFYRMVGTNEANEFLGLVIPNQEQIRLMEVTQGGRKLSMQEILDRLGWTASDAGSIFKRLSIATSDRVLSQVQDTPFNVVTFDTSKLLGRNVPGLKTQVNALARIQAGEGASLRDIAKVRKNIWETMSDGMSFVPDASIRQMIKDNQTEGRALIQNGRIKEGTAMLESAKQMLKDFNKGVSFNTRLLGGVDAATGFNLDFGKGDSIRITNESSSRLQRLLGRTPQNPREIAAFFPRADNKPELRSTGIRMRTLEPQGLPNQATSNVITTATFQDFLNPNRYFEKAMERDIADGIEGIRQGRITPGLRKMLDELKAWTPSPDASLVEIQQMREAQSFVRRLEKMDAAGVNFNISDTTTNQMFSALQKHYGRYQKGKFGQSLNFEGQQSPFFAMRFPMAGSTSAHMHNLDFDLALNGQAYNQTGTELMSNTLYIDQKSGRFGLRGIDIYRSKAAFGGMDLDDRLYSVLRYDSSAKRLLAFTFRDPTAMGEYNIFDADIANDRNIHAKIRKVWADKKSAEMDIIASSNKNKAAAMRKRDQAVDILNRYFNGEEVLVDGERVSQNFIEKVDIKKMFDKTRANRMFAPTGYAVSDSFEGYENSLLRSMRNSKEAKLNARTMAARLGKEQAAELSGQTTASPFIFKNLGYSEYRQGTGYFQMPEAVRDYINQTGRSTTAELSSDAIRRRIATEQGASGLLGRYVNAESVFDEFLQSNMRGLSEPLRNELDQTLKGMKQKLPDIPREVVIDASVKDAAEGVINAAEEGILTYHRNLGYLIGHMQQVAGDSGERVGLDPIFFQQRVATNAAGLRAMTEGYQASGAKYVNEASLLLPENDPKAYVSQMYKFFKNTTEELVDRGKELSQEAAERMLGVVGNIEFTPEEMGRASHFLEEQSKNAAHLAATMKEIGSTDIGETLRMMMDESADLADAQLDRLRYASDDFEEANSAAIRTLDDMGMFDSEVENGIRYIRPGEGMNRQILAIAKLASENKIADPNIKSVMDSLTLMSNDDEGLSMLDLFNEAVKSQQFGDMSKLTSLGHIQEFMGTENALKQMSHGQKLNLLDRIMDVSTAENVPTTQRLADDVMGSIYDSGVMQRGEYLGLAHAKRAFFDETARGALPLSRPNLRMRNIGPTGTRRYIRREAADTVANDVIRNKPLRERIERLDLNYVKKLVEDEPWAKKGLVGIAAFALLGVGHKIAKEITPEEAKGPPLLPGGSAYEDYPTLPVPSIYSSGVNNQNDSSLYQVNVAGGNYDPYELQSAMQKITGGMFNTQVYPARQTHSLRMNAYQTLHELMS